MSLHEIPEWFGKIAWLGSLFGAWVIPTPRELLAPYLWKGRNVDIVAEVVEVGELALEEIKAVTGNSDPAAEKHAVLAAFKEHLPAIEGFAGLAPETQALANQVLGNDEFLGFLYDLPGFFGGLLFHTEPAKEAAPEPVAPPAEPAPEAPAAPEVPAPLDSPQ